MWQNFSASAVGPDMMKRVGRSTEVSCQQGWWLEGSNGDLRQADAYPPGSKSGTGSAAQLPQRRPAPSAAPVNACGPTLVAVGHVSP